MDRGCIMARIETRNLGLIWEVTGTQSALTPIAPQATTASAMIPHGDSGTKGMYVDAQI